METAEFLIYHAVYHLVICHGAFGAHAADETNGFHTPSEMLLHYYIADDEN